MKDDKKYFCGNLNMDCVRLKDKDAVIERLEKESEKNLTAAASNSMTVMGLREQITQLRAIVEKVEKINWKTIATAWVDYSSTRFPPESRIVTLNKIIALDKAIAKYEQSEQEKKDKEKEEPITRDFWEKHMGGSVKM